MKDSAVAIIPARGGSKRIPRKNILDFCGKPMIAWSIEAAQASGCFESVIVSTEDEEIAAVARDCGAEVPFLRPVELADDYTGTMAVIAHTIEQLRSVGNEATRVCCIYATAPFVRPEDLRSGFEALAMEDCSYAFSVTSFPFPIQRALSISRDGSIRMLHPEHAMTRSQDLPEAYHDAGQFYWGLTDAWLGGEAMYGPNSRPVILPRYRVQDIDTVEDWQRAELMFKAVLAESGE